MKTAVAFGTFDGLHIGHRAVLEKTLDFNSVAVTFNMPPKTCDKLLCLPQEKIKFLKKFGIKEIASYDFLEVKDLLPEDFLRMVKERFSPDVFSCGFNFRFGKGASGDTKTLKKFARENKIELFCAPPKKQGETVISSTLIRSMIEKGNVLDANKLLFEDFGFSGEVVRGDGRGLSLGFPTVNQIYPSVLVTPRLGVYETEVEIDGKIYKGISNIGLRPTFKTENINAETFVLNFNGNVYGKTVNLRLKRFIRDERKFESQKELSFQIKKDISEVKL